MSNLITRSDDERLALGNPETLPSIDDTPQTVDKMHVLRDSLRAALSRAEAAEVQLCRAREAWSTGDVVGIRSALTSKPPYSALCAHEIELKKWKELAERNAVKLDFASKRGMAAEAEVAQLTNVNKAAEEKWMFRCIGALTAQENHKVLRKAFREAVRAVREDAIKTMRKYCPVEPGETCEECDAVEAAIRSKGKK